MELQEDMNKLVEWVSKWQISFNVEKCSVVHIGLYSMLSNYNVSNQLTVVNNRSAAGSRNQYHQRPQVAKTNRE